MENSNKEELNYIKLQLELNVQAVKPFYAYHVDLTKYDGFIIEYTLVDKVNLINVEEQELPITATTPVVISSVQKNDCSCTQVFFVAGTNVLTVTYTATKMEKRYNKIVLDKMRESQTAFYEKNIYANVYLADSRSFKINYNIINSEYDSAFSKE